MPLALITAILLYDRLASGHCSAGSFLMDYGRFGCRSLSTALCAHAVLMDLLLKEARAEHKRVPLFPSLGAARADFAKKWAGPKSAHSRGKALLGETIY